MCSGSEYCHWDLENTKGGQVLSTHMWQVAKLSDVTDLECVETVK